MQDTRMPEEVQADNNEVFMEQGPGLSYNYGIYVIARDIPNRAVLLGGLGGMGIGTMWWEDDGTCGEYPGYSEAPHADYEGGQRKPRWMMTPEEKLSHDRQLDDWYRSWRGTPPLSHGD